MPPKKQKQEDQQRRLDDLIMTLEDKLAIFNESELKKIIGRDLILMKTLMHRLEEIHTRIYRNVGFTWSDVEYPDGAPWTDMKDKDTIPHNA